MEISALYLSNLLEGDSARKHFSPQNVCLLIPKPFILF